MIYLRSNSKEIKAHGCEELLRAVHYIDVASNNIEHRKDGSCVHERLEMYYMLRPAREHICNILCNRLDIESIHLFPCNSAGDGSLWHKGKQYDEHHRDLLN